MTPDLKEHTRLLLGQEPTRSLPLGVLRERLRQAAGQALPGAQQLERALGADPAFRVLAAPPLIDAATSHFTPALLTAGFPQPECRVLLVDDQPAAARPELFGGTRDALLALLGRESMQGAVAEAFAALEEIGSRLRAAGEPLTADSAAHSTTPPPDPPRPPRSRRGARRPASRRPRR